MAKFGYKCKCGWVLRRGELTRKKYAQIKLTHAFVDPTAEKKVAHCKFLAEELNRTMKPTRGPR